jgi:uncharacterized repeat protein (TIGR02543 family)
MKAKKKLLSVLLTLVLLLGMVPLQGAAYAAEGSSEVYAEEQADAVSPEDAAAEQTVKEQAAEETPAPAAEEKPADNDTAEDNSHDLAQADDAEPAAVEQTAEDTPAPAADAEAVTDETAAEDAHLRQLTRSGGDAQKGDTPITSLALTVAEPVAGGAIPTPGHFINGETTEYTYTLAWYKGPYTGYWASGNFEKGKTYCASFEITPKEGYSITGLDSANVTVNGLSPNVESFYNDARHVYRVAHYFTIPEDAPVTSYTVSIDSSIVNGTVTADKTSDVLEGNIVTLTITPDSGYRLDSLTIKDAGNNDVSLLSDYTFKMPASDVTVFATFTTSILDEIRLTSSTTSVSAGTLPPFSVSTTTAHVAFIKNYGSNTNWVYWGPGQVVWHGFGGETPTAIEDGITHYGMNVAVNLEAGFEFSNSAKIYFNGTEVTSVGYTEIDAMPWGAYVTIDLGTAGTALATYTIIYDPNDGSGTMPPQSGLEGTSVNLSACTFVPPAGKIFKAWEIDGTEYSQGASYTLTGDVTAKAVWKDDNYIRESRATMTPAEITSNICANDLVFTSLEPSKYTVAFWRVYDRTDYSLNTSGLEYPHDSNFVAGHEYAIEFEFTAVSPYEYDEFHSETGSKFYLNDEKTLMSTATSLSYSPLRRIIKTATAGDKTTYIVTVTDDGNGTASASPTSGVTGTEVTLTATPNSGYQFKEWQVVSGGVTVTDNKFTIGTENVEVKAIFEEIPVTTYTVTVSDDGNGTASASPTSGVTGTEVTLTATPNSGYQFKEWQVISGGVSVTENKFAIGSENIEIKAIFEEIIAGQYRYWFGVYNSRSEHGTVSVNGTEWGPVAGNNELAGYEYTAYAKPDGGYVFKEWQDQGGAVVSTEQTYTFTLEKDMLLYAIFEEDTSSVPPTITTSALPSGKVNTAYNKTLEATGDTPITWTLDSGNLPAGLTLAADGKISGTPTTAGDYTFTVKATNGAGSNTKSFTVTIVLPVEVVITTQDKDGNVISTAGGEATADKTEVAKGETITVTPTVYAGFELVSVEFGDGVTGGYQLGKEPSSTVPDDFTTASGKLQIDVIFKEVASATTRTVTFKDGDSVLSTVTVNSGEKVAKPADPTKTGYTFNGWYADATFGVVFDFDQAITANTSIYAKFSPITVTGISIATPGKTAYTVGEALDVSGMEIKVDYSDGTSATIPVTAAMVSGFDSSASATSQTLTITYEGKTTTYDVSISATAPVTYDITVNVGANGTASASAASATAGTTITVTATANSGYEIDKITWMPEGGTATDITSTKSFTMPAAKVTVDVSFKASSVTPPGPTTYTVTFKDGESTLSTATVNSGEKVAKPADPTKSGYTFAGWYADATLSAAFDFNTPITANVTVYAKWTDNGSDPVPVTKYTITYDLNGGTMDGKTGIVTVQVDDGVTITLPAPTRSGYTFDYWEGSKYNAGDSYKVTGDHTFKAQWKANSNPGTNTGTDGETVVDSPKTGDDSNIALWLVLMVVSLLGFVFTLVSSRRSKAGRYNR